MTGKTKGDKETASKTLTNHAMSEVLSSGVFFFEKKTFQCLRSGVEKFIAEELDCSSHSTDMAERELSDLLLEKLESSDLGKKFLTINLANTKGIGVKNALLVNVGDKTVRTMFLSVILDSMAEEIIASVSAESERIGVSIFNNSKQG